MKDYNYFIIHIIYAEIIIQSSKDPESDESIQSRIVVSSIDFFELKVTYIINTRKYLTNGLIKILSITISLVSLPTWNKPIGKSIPLNIRNKKLRSKGLIKFLQSSKNESPINSQVNINGIVIRMMKLITINLLK